MFAATVLRFSSNPTRATEVLGQVDQSKLSPFGRAALQREHGLQLFAACKVAQAAQVLESAWQAAASDALGRRLSRAQRQPEVEPEIGRHAPEQRVGERVAEVEPEQRVGPQQRDAPRAGLDERGVDPARDRKSVV